LRFAARGSQFLLVFVLVWTVAMTWRLYPQFKDAVRVDGRITTVEGYVLETCSERVGPAAITCLAESRATAQRLLRHEQGKSILLIVAPLVTYLLLLPSRSLAARLNRARTLAAAE
jgi:hypothetical protein